MGLIPMRNTPEIRNFKTSSELIEETALFISSLARISAERFSISLAGGSTPKGLYERMARPDFAQTFPWRNVHFFWGDERFVPETDSRSNYKMTREALLSKAPVPAENIHAINTSLPSPTASADDYERQLKIFFKTAPGKFPAFDLVLLGLGEDGHTASLFPGDPALEITDRLAAPAKLETSEPRITLTYPVINNAKNVIFLVSGESKKKILEEVLPGENSGVRYPAQGIQPVHGKLFWFTACNY